MLKVPSLFTYCRICNSDSAQHYKYCVNGMHMVPTDTQTKVQKAQSNAGGSF